MRYLKRALDYLSARYHGINASHTVVRAASSTDYGGMGEREIQTRLEILIDLPNKDLSELFQTAKALTHFGMSDQLRLLEAAEQLSNISTELTHEFCCKAVVALKDLNEKNWQVWVNDIKSLAQQKSITEAIKYLAQTEDYVSSLQPEPSAVMLEQVRPVIEHLITGYGGAKLKVTADSELYTDTTTLYLPEQYAAFNSTDQNFSFYKLAATYLWAQSWFGTWRIDIPQLLYEHQDPEHAVASFHALETVRLTHCLKSMLPGIIRLESKLYGTLWQPPDTPAWQAAQTRLAQDNARAEDSIALIDEVYQEQLPKLYPCHGVFRPSRVYKAIKTRVDDNQKHLAQMLDKLRSQLQKQNKILPKTSSPFTLKFYEQALTPDEYGFVLNLDGEDIEIPEDLLEMFEQLSQDLGKIPEQLLAESESENATTTTTDTPTEATAGGIADLMLPEWDHAVQKYRKDWCHIYIASTDEGEPDFVKQTLNKHYGIIRRLHRTFEALRNDDRLSYKQTHGDEIDLDAVVESLVDTLAIKSELNDHIFIKTNKEERDVAVLFLIDMSASTRGWINRLEKEALLLLCESLQILGDRYAIYGFNSHTRKQCKIYPIKQIDEDYNAAVQKRISALKAELYTRMGAAIRYIGEHLQRYDAKTKILIVLSDGKPDDADGYRDSYGVEDTRKALIELRRCGIHSHCITIDKTGHEYLPYMYGHTRFSIINDIEKLPYRMAEIYRQITC
ncbi:MAG: VWA domain-containing protein [Chromatiales bacterium]|nr:VWA domain-containing protein [Chromatiales bacterium]